MNDILLLDKLNELKIISINQGKVNQLDNLITWDIEVFIMDNNTKLMSIVFNLDEPLFVREYPSDIVLFNTFSTIQTNTPIWVPKPNKSVFLTAVQATAPLPISIILSDGEDNFLSLRITEPFCTVSQRFFHLLNLIRIIPLW